MRERNSGNRFQIAIIPPNKLLQLTRRPCHVKRNDSRVWDRVLDLVDDPAVEVRRWVFHLLGDGSPRERECQIVAAMERFTRDPNRKLQRRARQVLAKYRRGGTINVL
jgi:hypothetical protein